MKVPDLYVGKRLFVGDGKPACLGIGPAEIRGSGYIEGPLVVGTPIFGGPEANVMISRCLNPEAIPVPPSIVKVRGLGPPTPIDVVVGDPAGPVGINCFCGPSSFVVSAATIDLINLKYFNVSTLRSEMAALSKDISAKFFAGAKSEIGIDHNYALALNSAPVLGQTYEKMSDFVSDATTLNATYGIAVSKKSFDIKHPSKDEHRLRYVCLEGPAAEVYVRGILKGKNIIELPDYWKDLVDLESISVQLTPIGCRQSLHYEEVEWGSKIKVVNSDCGPIWCSYTVFGERKDTPRNIPEYKGLTISDYPGDNSNYNVNK